MPESTRVSPNYTVRRSLPPSFSDDSSIAARGGRHGEGYVMDAGARRNLANAGLYFTAQTATPGTGIIAHASVTAFDATKPNLLIKNATAGGDRIVMDQLKLLLSVAGAAATSFRYEFYIDNVNRYTSGGTQLVARKPNMDESGVGDAVIFTGAITAPAAGSDVRLLDSGVLRQGLGVAGDEFYFTFGGDHAHDHLTPLTTVMQRISHSVEPCILGAGDTLLMYIYGAALTTAPTFEVKTSYYID